MFQSAYRAIDYQDADGNRRPDPEPACMYGPVYSIGSLTVCAYVVATDDGLVVIDTGYENGAEGLLDNIRAVGFDPADAKLIFNTHWHWDHTGGNLALHEISGAELCVGELDADIVETGIYQGEQMFPGCPVSRRLAGRETIAQGGVEFQVTHTPGQSAGSISITATVNGPGGPCRAIFAGDSTGFKNNVEMLEHLGYPGVCADYTRTIAWFRKTEFDLFCGGHPHQIFREMRPDGNPFVTRDDWLKLLDSRHGQMEKFVEEHPKYLEW